MSHIGIAYIAVSRATAEAMVSSQTGLPSEIVSYLDGSEVAGAPGFYYGTDLGVVSNSGFGHEVVLEIDLDDVLDLVETAEAGNPPVAAYDRVALGCEDFTVDISKISFMDGTMLDFVPLAQIFDEPTLTVEESAVVSEVTSIETVEVTETVAVTVKKTYDTPYLTRGQYFKKLREEGKLAPRQPKAPVVATNPSTVVEMKPLRSAAQQAAIRGSYARKKQAA